MPSYKNLAIDALSRCYGYDPYLPRSEAMVTAWAEALEHARIDTREDVLEAVRVMYAQHGEPGWRPTPRVLVRTALDVRRARLDKLAIEQQARAELEGPERITLAEWKRRHPDTEWPASVGKSIPE